MKLFYRELGEGTPLVIFHGLLGSSDNWLSFARSQEQINRVILPDLRNHGNSPHAEKHDYASMVEDVYELFQDLNLGSAIVMGHSMGGKVAMRFALTYPELVKKLLVVDIAPRKYKPRYLSILEVLINLETKNLQSRQQADEELAKKIKNKVLRMFLLKNLARDDSLGFSWRLNLQGIYNNMHSIDDDFCLNKTSNIRSLFICGEKSDYVLDADQELIKSIFGNAEILKIPGAGHWVHNDQPEEFRLISEKFIRSEDS